MALDTNINSNTTIVLIISGSCPMSNSNNKSFNFLEHYRVRSDFYLHFY